MKPGVVEYDITSSNATMDDTECVQPILRISGALSANKTVTLYHDTAKGYGRKEYTVLVDTTGDWFITFTAGGADTVIIPANGTTRIIHMLVDEDGNVYRDETRSTSIDGGSAVSVYLTEQALDGGAA
jgi:hypothetical protein